jgi:ABC-type phosphate transport system substrate-binding protein
MRNYSKIAAAVAVALGSGSVLAANPTWTETLNIAGSSALRDAVSNELSTVLCTAGTFTAFVSAKGTGGSFDTPDFRAFTCTLKAALPAPLGGVAVIVYYRSEGGSIFGVFGNSAFNSPGPGGVNGSLQINRLNIGPSGGAECQDNGGGGVLLGISQPTAANVEADNQGGVNGSCVVKDTVQLGFSDVEPAAFVGLNYGSEYTFINYAQPTVTQLNGLSKGTMIGQAFGAIVSNAGGTSGFANASGFSTAGLTSQELATIFAGKTTDWSNVPSAAAVGATAPAPITLCRREPGSGTQTIASTHFLHTNCGATNAGLPFATTTKAGFTVNLGFATSDVLTCVQTNPGAIGIVALQTAAKITGAAATQINLDGVQGNATNAAQGSYPWYAEAYFVKNPNTTDAFQTALVTRFISDMQSAANTPTNALDPNLVALPAFNAPFSPVVPLKAGQQIPIAIGTTSGSTCTSLTNVIG